MSEIIFKAGLGKVGLGWMDWVWDYQLDFSSGMKEQSSTVSRLANAQSGEIDKGEAKKPIAEQVSRSLLRSSFNKIIFATQAISMLAPIAYAYLNQYPKQHEPANYQVILIDFSDIEIDYLQQTLKVLALKHPKRSLFAGQGAASLNIVKMSNLNIQKRKIHYLKPGILCISSQIFLTDLLRGWNELHTLKIKVIVKLSDKILSHYHYLAWMTTFLKIKETEREGKENNLSFIYICNHVQHYSDSSQLSRIYRTFFCKKVIIWPFGRSEINKSLNEFKQGNCFKEWEHTLSMSDGERKLHETIMELYYFLKKGLGNKNTEKMYINGDHILYSSIVEDGFQFTRGEFTEFQHVKLLLILLQNSNKISIMSTIAKFMDMNECQIWNSNNNTIINLIDSIIDQLQSAVFHYQTVEVNRNIQLVDLVSNCEGPENQINMQHEMQYKCSYPLFLSLKIRPQTNEKINEVIKIIESIKDQPEPNLKDNEEEYDIIDRQLKKRSKSRQQPQQYHNVLIMCGLKGIQNFIRESIRGYQMDKTYLHYLSTIHRYLKTTRSFRLKKIRKIYDRRKVKKTDNVQPTKKSGDRTVLTQQNKLILQEVLLKQLQKLNAIILNFQMKQTSLMSDLSTSPEAVYQNNRAQEKLVQSFNQDLLQANFFVIDITLVKATYLLAKLDSIVFETNNTKKRIIVDSQKKRIEPNYFYQLLDNYKPSTIIFYYPNTLILRSLYLYQIEREVTKQVIILFSLKQIHILTFENSYEAKRASFDVTKEDKAFWNISQARSTLPEFIESPFLRVRNINFRDSIEQAKHSVSKSLFSGQSGEISISGLLNPTQIRRKILVDTRQFKSSLPSYLYHFGFEVIPVFLKTADYILSDDTAIEKKSVHTKDLHNSLKSFRLDDQLKRMSMSFKHPYLLIQCEEESDFVKSNFGYVDAMSGSRGRYELRKRLTQLLNKYPNVRIIWSGNVEQSCEFIRQLKEDKLEPDLGKFTKDQNEESEDKPMNLPRINEEKENEDSSLLF